MHAWNSRLSLHCVRVCARVLTSIPDNALVLCFGSRAHEYMYACSRSRSCVPPLPCSRFSWEEDAQGYLVTRVQGKKNGKPADQYNYAKVDSQTGEMVPTTLAVCAQCVHGCDNVC